MALRIIDLDIDESLSADTRVTEVGWVLQPAIETEFVYFSKDRMDPESLKKVQDYLLEYQPGSLPGYVGYATGDTKDNMLVKPILFVERQAGETEDEYISRCVEYHIKNEGMESDQAYAICKSKTEQFYKGQKVSFDYDDTLSTARGYGLALHEKFMGAELYIISAKRDKKSMLAMADKLDIPHDRVYATGSNREKLLKIKELGIQKHYDNDKEVIKSLNNIGVQFNCPCLDEVSSAGQEIFNIMEKYSLVGFMDGQPLFSTTEEAESYADTIGCNGHHVHINSSGVEVYMPCDVHPEKVEESMSEYFESITDYPQYITDNAIRAKKWVDENGYGSCMTPVGKARLNQLANREPISLETMKRMKAYADRHKKDLEASKSFDDGCGMLAWYSWGLDESGRAEKWLESEITQIESMSFEEFSLDDYSEEELETVKMLKFLMDTDHEEFERVVGSMRGSTEEEIFRRSHDKPVFYFKYERVLSGSPDRDFCTSIEGRYFRRLEIDLLRDTNVEFGHKGQPYSKWLYKGGPNCVHGWKRYIYTPKEKNRTEQLKDLGMVSGTPGIPPKAMPNNGYYNKDTKRKSEIAYIISQQNMSKQVFKSDKEQRMVYTPLMLPNILIPRKEDDGEVYFVRFRPEVIEKIRNKFMIEGRLRQNNYEHSDQKFNDMVMVESWIVSGPMDKAYELGFTQEQVPFGSWMGGYKILETPDGDILWNDYIKTGRVRGASVEGEFLLKFSSNLR